MKLKITREYNFPYAMKGRDTDKIIALFDSSHMAQFYQTFLSQDRGMLVDIINLDEEEL